LIFISKPNIEKPWQPVATILPFSGDFTFKFKALKIPHVLVNYRCSLLPFLIVWGIMYWLLNFILTVLLVSWLENCSQKSFLWCIDFSVIVLTL